MTDVVLVINAGSSSIKFALFAQNGEATALPCLYRGAIVDIGPAARLIITKDELEKSDTSGNINEMVEADSHEAALQHILNWLDHLPGQYRLVGVGHRVVHGGMRFTLPERVDRSNFSDLQALVPLAPLHQPHALRGIDLLLSLRPGVAQIACFDTAFHASMPLKEQLFALPRALAEQGIRRYGFHGLSYEYIASVLPDYLGECVQKRVVVAHLGYGASLCAMRGGRSVATTMSFTPLDGLPMATRCGSIDAAVVLYLLSNGNRTLGDVSDLLHNQSGLLGLSGISGDMRVLLASDSADASQAIAVFVECVHRELGSLAGALGGLDALVFTGGIGEHATPVRASICQGAAWLGIELDENANTAPVGRISTDESSVSAWVIPTDEEQVIARHTVSAIGYQVGVH